MTLIETHRIDIPVDALITGIMMATIGAPAYEKDGKFFTLDFVEEGAEPTKTFMPDDWDGVELIDALKVVRKFYEKAGLKHVPDINFEPLPQGVESKIVPFPAKDKL